MRGEVAGLDTGHGEQTETGEQGGTATRQRAVTDGDRQHQHGGARHPQPHHVERVESRLDQRLGRDSGSAEGERRHQRETETDASASVALTALRRMHRPHDDRR